MWNEGMWFPHPPTGAELSQTLERLRAVECRCRAVDRLRRQDDQPPLAQFLGCQVDMAFVRTLKDGNDRHRHLGGLSAPSAASVKQRGSNRPVRCLTRRCTMNPCPAD